MALAKSAPHAFTNLLCSLAYFRRGLQRDPIFKKQLAIPVPITCSAFPFKSIDTRRPRAARASPHAPVLLFPSLLRSLQHLVALQESIPIPDPTCPSRRTSNDHLHTLYALQYPIRDCRLAQPSATPAFVRARPATPRRTTQQPTRQQHPRFSFSVTRRSVSPFFHMRRSADHLRRAIFSVSYGHHQCLRPLLDYTANPPMPIVKQSKKSSCTLDTYLHVMLYTFI
ncbi:hypothetical protein C8J57DRAFT_167974 [Mycena rebaudengoi]|nr:hypothetical protein C8J57DRAFT_167974 [Mycena rebaudengoi]